MTTNFTFRDFFVYLLTGLTLIICLGTVFLNDIFTLSIVFFSKYQFVKEFSFLVTIFLVPAIYLLGHFIGSLSYNLLKFFVWIDKAFKKKEKQLPKWKYFILIKIQQILYRQRAVYAIIKFNKSENTINSSESVNDFWVECAKQQIERIYSPAEYWYVLNELFNSINLIFFITSITAFSTGHYFIGLIYFIMTIVTFKRARQYADHFVQTVNRIKQARKTTQPNKQGKL